MSDEQFEREALDSLGRSISTELTASVSNQIRKLREQGYTPYGCAFRVLEVLATVDGAAKKKLIGN